MKDIICLASFPKSGVTYLSFMLFYACGGDASRLDELEERYIIDIEAHPEANFAPDAQPHFIKSHYGYGPDTPFRDRTAKAILLVRHPIDVMMSVWNYVLLVAGAPPGRKNPAIDDPEFRTFAFDWVTSGGGSGFRKFGSWLNHVMSWQAQTDIEILPVRYEDLLDRPRAELERVLAFIDYPADEARIALALEKSSMKAMAEKEERDGQAGRSSVLHRSDIKAGFANGYRFINSASRNSFHTRLTPDEQIVAREIFGPALARYYAAETFGAENSGQREVK